MFLVVAFVQQEVTHQQFGLGKLTQQTVVLSIILALSTQQQFMGRRPGSLISLMSF
ncbi:hypothetical protein ACIN8IBEIGE_70040 [Acinetobacter sp. 8I-beige]|nr:hypothetical protein ACIN8IBEIGE_70040 [Acinetobacter sp. 8I-beige]